MTRHLKRHPFRYSILFLVLVAGIAITIVMNTFQVQAVVVDNDTEWPSTPTCLVYECLVGDPGDPTVPFEGADWCVRDVSVSERATCADFESALLAACDNRNAWPDDLNAFYCAYMNDQYPGAETPVECGCGGGGDDGDLPIGGGGEDPIDGGWPDDSPDCGDGPIMATTDSVSYYYGDKLESATDMVVPLTGSDFRVTREYSSNPAYTSNNLVGHKWSISSLRFIKFPDPGASGTGFSGGSPTNVQTSLSYGTQEWFPDSYFSGPTDQRWNAGTVLINNYDTSAPETWPVWELHEPGQWKRRFLRKNILPAESSLMTVGDDQAGLLKQEEDIHGNVRNFHYIQIGTQPGAGGLPVMRLSRILCRDSGGTIEAMIRFFWDLTTGVNEGRLLLVQALRSDGKSPAQYVETQRVAYTYKDSSLSNSLGLDGDLVQVVQSIRTDPGKNAMDNNVESWRHLVTQYRYHVALNNEGGSDGDLDGFIENGNDHQLKMVLLPEQIEFAVQQMNEGVSTQIDLLTQAETLLSKADNDTVYPGITIANLAAKVIEEYEIAGEGRVKTQFIQASCGCGGGATQNKRYAYTHSANPTGSGRTLRMDESYESGSPWTPYRTYYYDCDLPAGSNGPYLVTQVVVEDVVANSTQPGLDPNDKMWVTHFAYDGDRNQIATFTPAALSSYTPFNESNNTPPSYAANATGLVHVSEYNADSRLVKRQVKQGNPTFNGGQCTDCILVSEITYPPADLSDEREHLPSQITRYRAEGGVSDNDKEVTTFTYGFHGTTVDDDNMACVKTEVEAELESENGPASGGTYASYELYDTDGTNFWSIAADGCYTKRTFQTGTGRVLTVLRNLDRDDVANGFPSQGIPIGLPSDRFTDGRSLTSTFVRDLLGRIQQMTTPGGVSTHTRREMRTVPGRPWMAYYAVVTLPHDLGTGEYNGPATITWYNADDDAIESSEFSLNAGGYTLYGSVPGYQTPIKDYPVDVTNNELTRSRVTHDLTGLILKSTAWHELDPANEGFYDTQYLYDTHARVEFTTNPNGTVTRSIYDVLDRVIGTEVGTDTLLSSSNRVTVSEYFYDGGGSAAQGVGNGNLTFVRQHEDGSVLRDTKYTYDWRDRRILVENPLAPHSVTAYDNLDRVIHQGVFDALPTVPYDFSTADTSRQRLTTASYSQRGLTYRQQLAIDPTVAYSPSSAALETHTWYDEVGRAVGQWAPTSPGTKTTYDGLGRPTTGYVTDRHDDPDPGTGGNFAAVYDPATHSAVVDGDVVLEQSVYRYIDDVASAHSGMSDLVTHHVRTHDADDSNTGSLDGLIAAGGGDEKLVITTYSASYYDAADRVTHSVNYGTNKTGFEFGGTAPTITQGSAPAPNATDATKLVTRTTYNARGLVDIVESPDTEKSKSFYDDLNRQIAGAENYQDATVTWDPAQVPPRWVASGVGNSGSGDDDRVTSYVYDGLSNIIIQTAHLPGVNGANDQVTQYIYGITKGAGADDSQIASNDLLFQTVYPKETPDDGSMSVDVSPTITYAYNRLGEMILMADENGGETSSAATRHGYVRDKLGRVVTDHITNFATNIDTTIDAIRVTFDDLGRVQFVRSHNGYASESNPGTVKNAVEFTFDDLWQIVNVKQQHDGDITPTSPKVTSTYAIQAMSTGNFSRSATMNYPSGHKLDYLFGSAGSSDDLISRVRSFNLQSTLGQPGPEILYYDYLGLNTFAVVDYAIPDIQLDYSVQHNGDRPAGKYPGFDQYGRVLQQMWVDGNFTTNTTSAPNIPPLVETVYDYDNDSNRTLAYDGRTGSLQALSHQYSYDGLDRLSQSIRGKWNPTTQTVDHELNSQKWSLDLLGNWTDSWTEDGGNAAFDPTEKETRNHDDLNILNDRTPAGASAALDLIYDLAGNLRSQESPGGNTKLIYTHDAWDRLVKVEHEDALQVVHPRAEYGYNGLNWRVSKESDTDILDHTHSLSEQRLMIYNSSWQLVEERIDDEAPFTGGADIDRHVQYAWGTRYIDDCILHRQDSNLDGVIDNTWYHLTDVQFSTVAIIDESAKVKERITYTAYGRARHQWLSDVDGDGAVTQAGDLGLIQSLWSKTIAQSGYRAECDLNRDGLISKADSKMAGGVLSALVEGILSDAAVDNQIGYDGYVFNDEAELYTVRHRSYDPVLGRWLERDPLGNVIEMNLFDYAFSKPTTTTDSGGLQPSTPLDSGPCNSTCLKSFPLKPDSTNYIRCMAGCMNGLRGMNCNNYCSRWTDPVENAACMAGCAASKGQAGGGCVVQCPVQGDGPPEVLLGACVVAGASPEPFSKPVGIIAGVIVCGCLLYEIIHVETIDVPISRVEPIPLRRPPPESQGRCKEHHVDCVANPWQPGWNREQFGPRKDCFSCLQECNRTGRWPIYKCPPSWLHNPL